jgi:transcriptional regulator with XRE-family HTH domain
MNLPPIRNSATNVQEARRALGLRLRELRKQAGITGQQLAESLSWPPSKVSKLENGRQTPTDDDVRLWTGETHSTEETEALLASLHTLELQHAEWRRLFQAGLHPHQVELAELDERTRLFRAFEPTVVPGLLQTAEYARARFAEGIRVFHVPNDIDAAVRGRMQRQDMLYRSDKRFHFILTEAALRYRLCDVNVLLAQLDRLVSLSAVRTVRLGIIGFHARPVVAPWHGFWLLDNERVVIETYSAELNLAQPQEIALYSSIFEQLAGGASYGSEARAIITKVMDQLSADLGDTGSDFPDGDSFR